MLEKFNEISELHQNTVSAGTGVPRSKITEVIFGANGCAVALCGGLNFINDHLPESIGNVMAEYGPAAVLIACNAIAIIALCEQSSQSKIQAPSP